jgi:hypothetical protein
MRQAQARAQARAAVRNLNRVLRATHSQAAKILRRLARELGRKTLITADQLKPVATDLSNYVAGVEALQRVFASTIAVVTNNR